MELVNRIDSFIQKYRPGLVLTPTKMKRGGKVYDVKRWEKPGAEREMAVSFSKKDIDFATKHIASFIPEKNILLRGLSNLVGKDKVTYRLKGAGSLLNKLQRKDKDISDITDLVGLMVKGKNYKDLRNYANIVSKKFKVVEIEDFYKHERSDGYRAIHMLVEVNGKKMELQLRSVYFSAFGDWSHQSGVYKGDFSKSEEVLVYEKLVGDYVLAIEQGKVDVNIPPCPALLEARRLCFS